MPDSDIIVVDDEEATLAILLLNAAVPIWNWRERRSAPLWFDTAWPVGGIAFIFDPSYRVCFRHIASGRIYGIVSRSYEPYNTKPAMSFQRNLIDPKQVKRVERLVWLERPPKQVDAA